MSNSYSIKGTVCAITVTKQVSDRFRKRDLIIDVPDGKYPQVISFQVSNDRCDMIDGFATGDEITVEFNLRGREWKSPAGEVKYFNTLEAWKVERTSATQTRGGAHDPAPSGPAFPGEVGTKDDVPW